MTAARRAAFTAPGRSLFHAWLPENGMLNKTEFFAGVLLLFVCALFAWQISLLPEPEGRHVFTPGSFPKGVVALLALLSLRLVYKSLCSAGRSMWPERPVLIKVARMGGLMALYILAFVFFGSYCSENGLPDGTAFISATGVFLFLAQRLARPGNTLLSLAVSVVMTGLLFGIFYYLFKVQLP